MIQMRTMRGGIAPRIAARRRLTGLALVASSLICGSLVIEAAHADPPELVWQHYPGTTEPDYVAAAAIDGVGEVVIGGQTAGSIGRRITPGPWDDGFLIKYSENGEVLWRRQPRTPRQDSILGLATDFADNIVAVGYTYGPLAGPWQGRADGFIVKYAPDGTRLWQQQVGTKEEDFIEAVAIDTAGNIFVAGQSGDSDVRDSFDAFLIKYSADGTEQWRRVLASAKEDDLHGIAVDTNGNIVVVGYTYGLLGTASKGGRDVIVASFSAVGTLQWIDQSGTTDADWADAVAIGGGKIFVVGSRSCCTSSAKKGFLAAFSAGGGEQWLREIAMTSVDGLGGVAVASSGDVVMSGTAERKAYSASYTPDGTLQWTQQLRNSVYPNAVVTDKAGHFVTAGNFQRGAARGYVDGWVAKYELR